MSPQLPRVVRSGGAPPRVLLVDDHQQVVKQVSAMLAPDFEIAGVAGDGYQALDAARQVDPDLIVLDINMPRMDGFQTLRALADAGSHAPVVFLSMLDDEETVVEAFRRGGRGYVLKPHVGRHLANALDHVSQGRLFAPSLTSLYHLTGGGPAHVMQLHGGQPPYLDSVASLFDLALQRGDATCVIGTRDIRDGLAARLRDRGWDIDGHQRYRVIDAAEAVDDVMRNGMPDAGLLAKTAADLDQYRVSVTDDATGRLAIFGNMVAILKAQGNTRAVIALETLWSSVTQALPFFTVCGYDATCFHDSATDLWSSACGEHGAVSQAN